MRLCLTAVVLGILAILFAYGGEASGRYEDTLAGAFYAFYLYLAGLTVAGIAATPNILGWRRDKRPKWASRVSLVVFGIYCIPAAWAIGSSLFHEDVFIPFSYTVTVPGETDLDGLQIEILQLGSVSKKPVFNWQRQEEGMQITGTDSLHQRRAVLSLIGNADRTTLYSFMIDFPKDSAASTRFQAQAYKGAIDRTAAYAFLEGAVDEAAGHEPTSQAALDYEATER